MISFEQFLKHLEDENKEIIRIGDLNYNLLEQSKSLPRSLLLLDLIDIFQLTITKKMAFCRFYRDPLRKVTSKCSKTVITLIFWGIKKARITFIHQNVC